MSAGIRAGSSNDGYVQVNGNDIITALSGGNVGIGNTSPSTKLHVNGTVTATKFIGGFDGNSNISVDDWIVHTGDTDTKLGFSGADTISFHTAGAEVVKIGSTGNLELPRNNDYIKIGSGGSLSLVHTGSAAFISNSSGFLTHRCDTHQWEKGDGSAEYFRSNATGFAIGHVAPVRRFSVKSTGENAVSMSLLDNNSTNEIWRVGQASDGDGYVEVLEDGGTVGCKLDASGNSFTMGNFGVGVSSPNTALEVKGDITVSNTNNQGDIFFGEHGDIADSKALIRMDQLSSTAGELQFHTEGGGTLEKRVTIDSSGRVLIGATSSSSPAKLAVNGGINNAEAFFELNRTNDPANGQNVGVIEFSQGNSASRLAARIITRRDGGVWGAASLPTRFEFHTCVSGSNSTSEKLRISSTGTLILNQADSMIMTGADTSRLRLFGGSTNSVNNGATLSLNGVNHSAGNFADLSAATGGHIQFRVGTSEKLKITSNGHVQIISGNLEFANGSGIDFSNVPDGSRTISTDGNKFDDYEEGLWTPQVLDGNGANYTISYNSSVTRYVKIGRVVYCWYNITRTESGSKTGTLRFYASTLPFSISEAFHGGEYWVDHGSPTAGQGDIVGGVHYGTTSGVYWVLPTREIGTTSTAPNRYIDHGNWTNGRPIYGMFYYTTAT